MNADKFYYVCHLPTQTALELRRLTSTWGQITGMEAMSEEHLADLSWAGHVGYAFYPEENIGDFNITEESIAACRVIAIELEKPLVREERNELLADSDKFVVADRWEVYSSVEKNAWAAYRDALRTLPETIEDWFNPIWPVPPAQ